MHLLENKTVLKIDEVFIQEARKKPTERRENLRYGKAEIHEMTTEK